MMAGKNKIYYTEQKTISILHKKLYNEKSITRRAAADKCSAAG